MIKILGRANSVNVQKAMWCAAELGLKVERTDIGGAFGGTDTDEYGALNPNRKIPVLIDGDFTLWESNTIVRYLCAQYGDANWRLPTAASQAHADQWMDWYLTTLHPPMGHPRPPPRKPTLHPWRHPQHGRHPRRLLRLSLALHGHYPARSPQPAPLVEQPHRPPQLQNQRHGSTNLITRKHRQRRVGFQPTFF